MVIFNAFKQNTTFYYHLQSGDLLIISVEEKETLNDNFFFTKCVTS